MRLLQFFVILICASTTLLANPPLETKAFRTVDGLRSLQMALPYAVEEHDGDESHRRYGISDKRGRLLVWLHLFPGCNSSKAVDLILRRQAPIEFRLKEGDQFSTKTVRLRGRKIVRLIDPGGTYVIHVVESNEGAWILATWTLRWSQERMRMPYVYAFISAVTSQ